MGSLDMGRSELPTDIQHRRDGGVLAASDSPAQPLPSLLDTKLVGAATLRHPTVMIRT